MSLWRSSEMLLPPLLLMTMMLGVAAQSGDGHANTEQHGLSCSSDISREGNTLSCELLGGRRSEDEEDEDSEEEPDSIARMILCVTDYVEGKVNCVKERGSTLSFKDPPVSNFNLTVHLKRGGIITTMVNMKKIVKPRSPSVSNVTVHHESNMVFIHVSTPYIRDYLTIDNQLFQLHIWSSTEQLILNMTSETIMKINLLQLHKNTEYSVKVRAIPLKELEGIWSEWSNPYTFHLPEDAGPVAEAEDEWYMVPTLTLGFVSVVVVIVSIVFFWKKKIFTYMWPNIPHPKDTLVHLCKPNKHLLLNFNPEVYSALRVAPLQTNPIRSDPLQSMTPLQPEPFHSDPVQSSDPGRFTNLVQPEAFHSDLVRPTPSVQSGSMSSDSLESTELLTSSESSSPAEDLCSTKSSDCRSTTSISTEESELAALLDRSCSDGETASLQSTSPSSNLVAGPGDSGSSGQQEEAYVTMSSFYQTK